MENQNNNETPQQLGYVSSKAILGDLDATEQTPQPTVASPVLGAPQPTANNAPNDLFVGMTSKDIVHERPKRLIGIYVFIAIWVLQIPLMLFTRSIGISFLIQITISIVMIVGVLLRNEAVRKIIVGLAVLSVIVMAVGFVRFNAAVNKLNSSRPQVNAELNKIINDPSISSEKRQKVQDFQKTLEAEWDNMHNNLMPRVNAVAGISILVQASTVVYFMLPKVRRSFREND